MHESAYAYSGFGRKKYQLNWIPVHLATTLVFLAEHFSSIIKISISKVEV